MSAAQRRLESQSYLVIGQPLVQSITAWELYADVLESHESLLC